MRISPYTNFMVLDLKVFTCVIIFIALLYHGQVVVGTYVGILRSSTTYKIELYPNCSALWSITYCVPLLSAEDRGYFEAYIKNFTASQQDFLDSFEKQMAQMVEEASNLTGRNMSAQGFDVHVAIIDTPPASLGTVTYSFMWTVFLEKAGSALFMGDVFEGGLYLYENDSIVVVPPRGYRIDFVSPQPDAMDGSVIWHGPRNFSSGEPSIEFLSMETKLTVGFESEVLTEGDQAIVSGRIEPPLAVVVNVTYTKPDGETISQTLETSALGLFTSKIIVDEAGTWKVQASWEGNRDYLGSASQTSLLTVKASFLYTLIPVMLLAIVAGLIFWFQRWRRRRKPLPPLPENDEELVLVLLRSSGGQMFQRDIGRKLNFSKSKTTDILNDLETKHLIEKEKRGRKYLVKLI
jgi:hypothetical protein